MKRKWRRIRDITYYSNELKACNYDIKKYKQLTGSTTLGTSRLNSYKSKVILKLKKLCLQRFYYS